MVGSGYYSSVVSCNLACKSNDLRLRLVMNNDRTLFLLLIPILVVV
jgi:hypothetical protein